MTGIIDIPAGLTSATVYFGIRSANDLIACNKFPCIPSFLFSFPAYMKNQQTKKIVQSITILEARKLKMRMS